MPTGPAARWGAVTLCMGLALSGCKKSESKQASAPAQGAQGTLIPAVTLAPSGSVDPGGTGGGEFADADASTLRILSPLTTSNTRPEVVWVGGTGKERVIFSLDKDCLQRPEVEGVGTAHRMVVSRALRARQTYYLCVFTPREDGTPAVTAENSPVKVQVRDGTIPANASPIDLSFRDTTSLAYAQGKIFLWGGYDVESRTKRPLATGAVLDLSTLAWSPISQDNAPGARLNNQAMPATSQHAVVWGGTGVSAAGEHLLLGEGASLSATTGAWSAIAGGTPPSARRDAIAVRAGDAFVAFWGGHGASQRKLRDGGLLHAATGRWHAIGDAPGGAEEFATLDLGVGIYGQSNLFFLPRVRRMAGAGTSLMGPGLIFDAKQSQWGEIADDVGGSAPTEVLGGAWLEPRGLLLLGRGGGRASAGWGLYLYNPADKRWQVIRAEGLDLLDIETVTLMWTWGTRVGVVVKERPGSDRGQVTASRVFVCTITDDLSRAPCDARRMPIPVRASRGANIVAAWTGQELVLAAPISSEVREQENVPSISADVIVFYP